MPKQITKTQRYTQWQCRVCHQEYGMYDIAVDCETGHTMRGAYEVGQIVNNGHQTIVAIDYKRDTIRRVLLELGDGSREWKSAHYLNVYG